MSTKFVARWWFQGFLCSALFGEMIQFDSYFSDGLKPPTSLYWVSYWALLLLVICLVFQISAPKKLDWVNSSPLSIACQDHLPTKCG